jgi:hypothetical protein
MPRTVGAERMADNERQAPVFACPANECSGMSSVTVKSSRRVWAA